MKEIIISIHDSMKQRIKSPFIGAYILSFLAYNWKPLSIYLRSDQSIETIVNQISSGYASTNGFLIPLVFSFLFVTLVPYLHALIDLINKRATDYRITHRYIIKHQTLSKEIESAEFERAIADTRAGTKEREALLAKLNMAEMQAENVTRALQQQSEKSVAEQEILAGQINDIRNENMKLKNEILGYDSNYKTAQSQLLFFNQIYPMLIKTGKNSKIEIQHFLKKYLNQEEVILLKDDYEHTKLRERLPFREEVNVLLITSGLYEFNNESNNFFITEAGERFVVSIT